MLTKERKIKEKIKQIMKQLKNNKEEKNIMKNKGISLITLVITIIIMIILAGAIILTLTNSGIFDKANDAVSKYSLKQVQAIADLAWAEAYADNIRDKDGLQKAVDKALEDNDLDDKYKAVADEKGVTVTEKVESAASKWVSEYTEDGVPIPVGFVASPYGEHDDFKAENTKAGGLVIYALTPEEIEKAKTEKIDILAIDGENGSLSLEDAHYVSMKTRNQFVWVPVNKDNFKDEFVRDSFGQNTYKWEYDVETGEAVATPLEISKKLGDGCWEVALDANNMPLTTQDEEYVSKATLDEATEMYKSVAEYGGFYIARYEVGVNTIEEAEAQVEIGDLFVAMGKYPLEGSWVHETYNEGAIDFSRRMYPNDEVSNITGAVSTLTYGVQWDRTLNWWLELDPDFNITNSTSYGVYDGTQILQSDLNVGAKYKFFDDDAQNYSEWLSFNEQKTNEVDLIFTTGAYRKANVYNIYDMAGNMCEWTMEGANVYDGIYRIIRAKNFPPYETGDNTVTRRHVADSSYNSWATGFRPSLYIKVK